MALRSHAWSRRRVRGLQSAAELWSTARSAPACRTQSRLREHGGRRTTRHGPLCLADPATPTGCECGLKSPGSRLRLPFFGDVTFFYTVTAPPRPAPRRLRRDASRFAATPHAAPPRAAPPRPAPHRTATPCPLRPCLRPAPPCEDITKCSLYTLVCTGSLLAAYR